MTSQRFNFVRKVALSMVTLGLGILLVAGWGGCGTPRERYHTLSIFFDGVPNPDAVKKPKLEEGTLVAVVTRHVTQHPPYRDNKCDSCHRTDEGEIQDFNTAYKQCIKCHKPVTQEHARMHGPVVREDCRWCHAPHESAEPHLLKDKAVKVCTQCHDKTLLGATPAEHMDGKTSCLDCHSGHGGAQRYFLKTTTSPAQPAAKQTVSAHAVVGGRLLALEDGAEGPTYGDWFATYRHSSNKENLAQHPMSLEQGGSP